ncbi:MAG: hypothetical protein KAQ92_01130, partial [Candidatus Aenigmarchaeota archaeon]|nr:hypothetical protein [Candidatus Aenigmarchaeota archaeon]
KNITVEITIPEYQDPGIYTGYINTTFDNEPTQQITLSLTVNTNSSWFLEPIVNKTNMFLLSESGVIGNVTIKNTGNIPLNYTIIYDTNAVCDSYTCMGSTAQYNPAYVYVAKNSTQVFGVWQQGTSSTKTNAQIEVNVTNSTGTPQYSLAYMFWNITNAPPVLINLTTLPKNYVELDQSITLYAIISDDENELPTTGMNLSSVYFNVTDPSGYIYHIDNNSISYVDDGDHEGNEQDRKKFNHTFTNTSMSGIHNLTVYIKDKSNNEINISLFQFNVIGTTDISITAAAPPTAQNVTILHGENLTIPVNITNTGQSVAYNITITGTFGSGAESWTVWNKTYGNITETQAIQENITITVASTTVAGNYQFTPKVTWNQPNSSLYENTTSSPLTVNVAENPEIIPQTQVEESMNHGEQKLINIPVNSTGNDDYDLPSFYIVEGTASGWVCFSNYCSNSGTTTYSFWTELMKGSSYNLPVYLEVPQGTVPGNYTSQIEINSTSYTSSRYKTVNLTITVLDDRNWTISEPFN